MINATPTAAGLFATVLAAASVCGAEPPRPRAARLFAAVGVSTGSDAARAGERAARSMLAKFRAAARRPAVAIFLDRTARGSAKAGGAIGDRVRDVCGAPTYGSGGRIGPAGVTWWAKRDREPTFLVLGLCGAAVAVRPYVASGASPSDKPAAEAQARALGRQVARPGRPAALLLGGLAGETGGAFLAALRKSIGSKTPLLAAVGAPGDYVYANARAAAGADGHRVAVGQLLLVIEGDFAVATAGVVSRNVGDAQAVLAEADTVARHAVEALAASPCRAVLAVSDAGRLRASALDRPGTERARLCAAFGRDVPVFGCFSFLQAGLDNRGRFSVGRERLMLVALGDAPPASRPGGPRP